MEALGFCAGCHEYTELDEDAAGLRCYECGEAYRLANASDSERESESDEEEEWKSDDGISLMTEDTYYQDAQEEEEGNEDFLEDITEQVVEVSYRKNCTLAWNESLGAYVNCTSDEESNYDNDGF